jgi:DNA modification methylase
MRKPAQARSAPMAGLPSSKLRKILSQEVVWRPVRALVPYPNNPRRHPDSQIAALAKNIARHGWTNPILVDERLTILCGHGRLEAADRLALTSVPTLMLVGLSDAEKRAIVIADNRLSEQAEWDIDLLKVQLQQLVEIDYDVELTGYDTGEVDILLGDGQSEPTSDPDDDLPEKTAVAASVTFPGDLWKLGPHLVYCGNALERQSYQRLLGDTLAQMVVTDPPYNVSIASHARGRSKVRHREFAMASGEMSEIQFTQFLDDAFRLMIAASMNGAIHYTFMDWRHLPEALRAGIPVYSEFKNLLVWNKSNAGQGSFYRSKHELILAFKNGTASHINNFGLGSNGRYRTNVLDYPGGTNPSGKRQEELAMHPTVKPVALIADLMRDCSHRNGIILDPFGGSGTVVLAAQRSGRIARMIEIDPQYVDLTIARWERMSGEPAVHADSGQTFSQIMAERTAVDDLAVPHKSRRRTGRV